MIPAGTGNDFARTIGLSSRPAEAAGQLISGGAQGVDVVEINEGEHWSVNVLGAGLDARVAERTNRRTRLIRGPLPYLIALGRELIEYTTTHVRVRVDQEEWEGEALLVAIANACSYGGGMRIAPQACIDDGELDVVVVEPPGRAAFIRKLPSVFRGTHVDLPWVRTWRGTTAELETDSPCPVMVDGDLALQAPVRARVRSEMLRLWMPGARDER